MMFKLFHVFVYQDPGGKKLFNYKTRIPPIVGDRYTPTESDGKSYIVTYRMLHTRGYNRHAITLWAKEL